MKIRHPLLIKAAGLLAAWMVRGWIGSVRFRYCPQGDNVSPHCPGLQERFIYSFWHENLLVPALYFARRNVHVLISEHADGRLIAEACKHLNMQVVTGSSGHDKKGARAVRKLIQVSDKTHIVITPDGPRGPRHKVHLGMIYLASQSGLPIVPSGFGYHAAWRLNSWDRFVLPCPGSAAVCVTGPHIQVPANIGRKDLETYRSLVEEGMERATAEAERLAARESW
jgi:lysophospholipid acyltransferase (LPLAT)-like uncharacterized protein